MMDNALFSVLIANYNNGRYIEEALSSVFAQTYTNWEIIIVDDASLDESREIYKKYEDDPRIKVFFNQRNQGCGYTKRKCVEEAEGEICGFLDPDDKLDSKALELMISAHVFEPEVSLIHSTFYICDENLENPQRYIDVQNVDSNNPYFFNLDYYIRLFSTFKKSYYDKTNGINPSLLRAVDQDLYLKLYEVGKTYLIDKPLYYYRIHKGGISTLENVERATFWHWVVNIDAARRRNVNIEDVFVQHFVSRTAFRNLEQKEKMWENRYLRLKKYERINNLMSRIKKALIFKRNK